MAALPSGPQLAAGLIRCEWAGRRTQGLHLAYFFLDPLRKGRTVWPEIDKYTQHCAQCSGVFEKTDLSRGLCSGCITDMNQEATSQLKAADRRVLARGTNAAAKLLSALHENGKGGRSVPTILEAFWREVGGQDKFGSLLAMEFQKARGEGLTQEEIETFDFSPKLVKDWFELMLRHIDRDDQTKTIDIGALEEADLQSVLVDVGRRAILEDAEIRRAVMWTAIRDDKEFREQAFYEILRQDKELLDKLIREGGILTYEAEDVRPAEDDNLSPDTYNPMDDES